MNNLQFTPDVIERINSLVAQGKNSMTIAEELGISRPQLRYRCERYKVSLSRSKPEDPNDPWVIFMRRYNLSNASIARELGVSRRAVGRWRQERKLRRQHQLMLQGLALEICLKLGLSPVHIDWRKANATEDECQSGVGYGSSARVPGSPAVPLSVQGETGSPGGC